jgi:hypothetical protein
MKLVQLPVGHNNTVARFQRVSRGVNYAYSGYRPERQSRPLMGGFIVLCITVALFAIAIKI